MEKDGVFEEPEDKRQSNLFKKFKGDIPNKSAPSDKSNSSFFS